MKTRNVICISLTLMMLVCIAQGHAAVDPKTAVGVWLFDEGAGKTTKELSEKGNDGAIQGNPKWVDGKFGKALKFGEPSDWVQVTDHPSLRVTKAYSVMAWINAERHFFPGTQWQGVIAKANNPRSESWATSRSSSLRDIVELVTYALRITHYELRIISWMTVGDRQYTASRETGL